MPSEPTDPGFYYWRERAEGWSPAGRWRPVEVTRSPRGKLWVSRAYRDDEPIEMATRRGEWGHRIPSEERLAELEDVERRLHEARRQVAEATFEERPK